MTFRYPSGDYESGKYGQACIRIRGTMLREQTVKVDGRKMIRAVFLMVFVYSNALAYPANKHCTTMETALNLPHILNYGNKTYFIDINKKLNWFNALRTCHEYNMRLVSVDSDQEMDKLTMFAYSVLNSNAKPKEHLWTSGSDLGQDKKFYWMTTGKEVLSNRWFKDQPNHIAKQDCIHFYNDNGFTLNDIECSNLYHFICEAPRTTCSIEEEYA